MTQRINEWKKETERQSSTSISFSSVCTWENTSDVFAKSIPLDALQFALFIHSFIHSFIGVCCHRCRWLDQSNQITNRNQPTKTEANEMEHFGKDKKRAYIYRNLLMRIKRIMNGNTCVSVLPLIVCFVFRWKWMRVCVSLSVSSSVIICICFYFDGTPTWKKENLVAW